MNKNLMLVSVLLLISASASAMPSFVQDSKDLSGNAGQTVNSDFDIENVGSEDISIAFSNFTLKKGADQLTITSLNDIDNLAAGEQKNVDFSVVISSNQEPGTYTGTLRATSNLTDEDTLNINVEVNPILGVEDISDINLGSVSLNTSKSATFDITNNGNANLTSVKFTFSDADFNFKADKENFMLAAGETETVEFTLTVPADYSTGNVTFGSVSLDSEELDKELFDVRASVGGGLIIDDLDVTITTRESKSDSHLDVEDGDKLKFDEEKLGPETEIRFNFVIENTFSGSSEIDINNIAVIVTIEEIDDGSDIEEESEEFDLEATESKDADVFVNIPLSVNTGSYDVLVEVEGEDGDDNEHTAQMNLRLDVDKEPRDMIVKEANVFPAKIICSGTATFTAVIKNIGTRLETDSAVQIFSSDLDINVVERNIELEEDPFEGDNEFTRRTAILIDSDTEPGTYPIEARAFVTEPVQDDNIWDRKIVNLVIEACETEVQEVPEEATSAEEEPEEKEIQETELVESTGRGEDETEGVTVPVLKPITTTEIPLTKRPLFWMLALFNVIVIVAILFLVFKFRK